MNGKSLPESRNNTVSPNDMLNFGKQTVKFVLSVIFSGFILYLILNEFNEIATLSGDAIHQDELFSEKVPKQGVERSGNDILNNTGKYFKWLCGFITGDYGKSPNSEKIIVFSVSDLANKADKIEIWPNYFHTISITLLAITIAFIISFVLNTLEIVRQTKKLEWIKTILNWLSSVHIIILGIILFLFFRDQIPVIAGIIMIAICSNAFYDLSALQANDLSTLYNKDFVIAARAWGDNIWKHMRRSLAIDGINQFSSVWIIIFTNTLIYEIICQKPGLGFLLFLHFLDSERGKLLFELDLFMTLTMFIIITIFMINFIRDVTQDYLLYKRR